MTIEGPGEEECVTSLLAAVSALQRAHQLDALRQLDQDAWGLLEAVEDD